MKKKKNLIYQRPTNKSKHRKDKFPERSMGGIHLLKNRQRKFKGVSRRS